MQKNSEKTLNIIREKIRDLCVSKGFTQLDGFDILLKFLVIKKLSDNNQIDNNQVLSVETVENKSQWLDVLEALAKHQNINVKKLFINQQFASIDQSLIIEVYKLIDSYQVNLEDKDTLAKFINNSFISLADKLHRTTSDLNGMPRIKDLAFKLVKLDKSKSLYSNTIGLMASLINFNQYPDCVYLESINEVPIFYALPVLCDFTLECKQADYIRNPKYVKSNHELKKFDVGISFPGMNHRLSGFNTDIDGYERFYVKTRTYEVATIQHLIKQCNDVIVCSVIESCLFSSMELELRRFLIDNGYLKAVISLPSGIYPNTMVKTSLLVIEPNGNNNGSVRFVDTDQPRFIEKTGFNSITLKNIDEIVELVESQKELKSANCASKDQIQDQGYDLTAQKYILNDKDKAINQLLQKNETVKLKDIVIFKRSLPHKVDEGDYSILEVGAAELNEFGVIDTPTKEIKLSELAYKKHEAGFLQPNDILIMLKGSAGKVGIIPENLDEITDKNWMVNKSGIVMRVIQPEKYNPKALFVFLRSEVGQAMVANLVKGANIPNISLGQLKELPILLPSAEEQQQAISNLQQDIKDQQKIKAIKRTQLDRKNILWAFDNI